MIMKYRKNLTWLVCLLFLAGVTLSSSAGILCLGEDGHAQVESFCQPDCNDSDLACPVEGEETDDDHDDCTNCVDVPLIQDLLSHRYLNPVRSDEGVFIYSAAALESLVTDSSAHSSLIRIASEAGSDTGPDLLSATVLRC